MIRRTAHKNLEATLLSHSSASTRRPHAARYTTPSKPASAQAALAQAPPRPSSSSSSSPVYVHPPASYTFIPTPLPEDRRASNDQYFPDTGFQDLLAVMNACLHNGYDVRRALSIFEDLRDAHTNHPHFDVRVVNRILAACLDMAEREPAKAALWIDDFYEYLQIARDGTLANVVPNASTYALALRAWLAHGDPETDAFASSSPWASLSSSSSSSSSSAQQPPFSVTILEDMIQRSIDVRDVVTDRAIPSDEVGAAMVRSLIKATTHERVKDRAEFREVALVLVQAEQVARHLQPDALADVEGVRPVEVTKVVTDKDGQVKGEETEVPFNLKVLREHLDNASLFRRMLPEDNLARQYLLERSVLDIASERMRKIAEQIERLGQPPDVKNQSMQAWIWSWHTKLVERLKQDIRKVRREENRMHQGTADQRGRVAPFLELLKVEKLSLITILEIIRLHGTGGVQDGMKTARALVAVGKAVELEYKSELQRKHGVNVPDVGPGLNLHNRRVMARKLMEDGEEWASDWSQIIRVRVGAFLVYRLMDVATVWQTGKNLRTGKELVEEHPAFSHSYEYFRGYKLGTIRVAPMISSAIAKDNLRETLHPRHLPMLVPPAPWLNWQTGGYLSIPSPVMRFKDSVEQKSLLKKAISDNRMDDVLAGLDALGQTPWRINRDVFDVVLKVWNSGERLCKIPPASFDEPEPARDDTVEFDPAARQQYLARLKQWQQDRASNHSDRCSVNYKIEIARAFLNDVFYLPHNLDFRGRAYPLPPHLNHIGNDLSRGLLLFAEGKPLGVRGLRWLKIHLANLYGYDKATFDERVQFVDDRIAEIRDSATNPLDGQGWWKKADDPWQCLSACIQLTRALDSPDPLAYECPLPVHQDGTCNGLQHYAALGGDDQGARQVNLAVAERPSDVYTYVADMVERRIEADLSSDVQKDRHFAGLLAGKIARKVVKQTVMTTVYGVTFVGAREQIEKQLRERGDVPAEDVYFAAAYLAKQVLRCIGDLFKGANSIMNWLTLSARIIAKSVPGARLQEAVKLEEPKGTWKDAKRKQVTSRIRKEQMGAVTWTTLLGLPVVQPYRKIKRKQVNTSIQSVFISDPNVPAEVNSQKQASAFPPNFIHSLDATHMLMTALECQARGMQFAAVHDSYWTHAADIDPMSDVIRDTFIRLHSSDVLSRLDAEFKTRYADHKVPIISTRTASVLRAMGVLSGEAEETVIEASDETADELEAEQELDLKPLTSSADGKRARSTPKPVASADLEDPEDTIDDLGAGDVGALSAMAEEAAEVAAVPQALADAGEMSDEHREELMQLLRKSQSEYPSVTVEPGTLDDARREQQSKMLAGKFVNLVNLLPPLPKKGSFDVTKIKNSLYFFS